MLSSVRSSKYMRAVNTIQPSPTCHIQGHEMRHRPSRCSRTLLPAPKTFKAARKNAPYELCINYFLEGGWRRCTIDGSRPIVRPFSRNALCQQPISLISWVTRRLALPDIRRRKRPLLADVRVLHSPRQMPQEVEGRYRASPERSSIIARTSYDTGAYCMHIPLPPLASV